MINLLDKNNDLRVVFVDGKYAGQEMKVSDLINLKDFTGKLSRDASQERANGSCVKRAELDCIPEIDGYTHMWDGDKIRFETWEHYNRMFD